MIKDEGIFIARYLARQVREPVQFVAALAACKSQLKPPDTMWLEVGPKPFCLSMTHSSEGVPEEMLLTPQYLYANLDLTKYITGT